MSGPKQMGLRLKDIGCTNTSILDAVSQGDNIQSMAGRVQI